jgi:hypothetical protein
MIHDSRRDFSLANSNDHCEFAIDVATLDGNIRETFDNHGDVARNE